jgi:hypothetical protein
MLKMVRRLIPILKGKTQKHSKAFVRTVLPFLKCTTELEQKALTLENADGCAVPASVGGELARHRPNLRKPHAGTKLVASEASVTGTSGNRHSSASEPPYDKIGNFFPAGRSPKRSRDPDRFDLFQKPFAAAEKCRGLYRDIIVETAGISRELLRVTDHEQNKKI